MLDKCIVSVLCGFLVLEGNVRKQRERERRTKYFGVLPSLSLSRVYLASLKLRDLEDLQLEVNVGDACDQLPYRISTLFYSMLSVIAACSLVRSA